MTTPAAAIVVPAYNCAATIVRTLDSVARSIEFHRGLAGIAEFEIIVVDDASTDSTRALVETWAAERNDTRLLSLDRNSGVSRARNVGMADAKAPLIFLLDSDDEFLEPHVFCSLETLTAMPNIGYSRTQLVLDAEIHPTWSQLIDMVVPSNLCVRKVCHEFVSGFIEHDALRTYRCEDLFYATTLGRYFAGVAIDMPTVHYTSAPGSAFDRQLPKFRRPMGEGPDVRTLEERRLQPIVDRLDAERVALLDARARSVSWPSAPKLFIGTRPAVARTQGSAAWLRERQKPGLNRRDTGP